MRRATPTLVAALVAGGLLAGCPAAGGLDGDLTDDWRALPAAGAFTPAAGVCQLADPSGTITLAAYQPVGCDLPHRVETVHVGAFRGGPLAPPAVGSVDLRGAFADCDTRASAYVGDDWRAGRLRLAVAVPSAPGWNAGSRWYRCDLAELSTVEANAEVVSRTGQPAGRAEGGVRAAAGLPADRDRRRRKCAHPDPGGLRHQPRRGVRRGLEGAGDRPYPRKDADWAPFYTGCGTVLARYAGVPDGATLRYRSGVVVRPPARPRWTVGDRGVRCYLWLSDRTVTASLAGAGPAGLPVRTR